MKSLNSLFVFALSCALCNLSLAADEIPANGLVAEEGRGRWSFSAGPSWRSRIKMESSGFVRAPAPERRTIRRDMNNPSNWDRQQVVADPNAGTAGIPADGELWGVTDTRTEIYSIPGQDYVLRDSDTDAPLGLNLQACYDFLQGDTWSLGLNLRFAGYWNMKSGSSGRFNAGLSQVDTFTDLYVFEDSVSELPFADSVDPLYSQATPAGVTDFTREYYDRGSRIVNTRLRSDLYQIGLGPRLTWSPFVGWCECMRWLDVYGGVEVLCNIAYNQFDADGSSSSSTDCLLGFGGNVGLVGNITDSIGIYGQVGYEWIDDTDVSTGAFKSNIDYSSLVLSLGLQYRF